MKDPYLFIDSYLEKLDWDISLVQKLKRYPLTSSYQNYPFYFLDDSDEGFDQLFLANYFLFQHVLLLDKSIDTGIIDTEALSLSNSCLEKSVLFFADFFDDKNEFWTSWARCRAEWLKAVKIDKEFNINMSCEEFERQSDRKHSFTKVIIHASYSLGQVNEKEKDALIKSNYCFNRAVQLFDDLLDVKEDIENKQANYVLAEFLRLDNDYETEFLLENPVIANKLIFVKGHLPHFESKGLKYLDQAKQQVDQKKFYRWIDCIEVKRNNHLENFSKMGEVLDKLKN